MWQTLFNTLPTTDNLFRRKIPHSPNCQRCQITKEDVSMPYCLEKFEGFAVLAWSVWKSTSLALFEKGGIDTLSTLVSVNSLIQAYKDAEDSYLNSDTTTCETEGFVGLGVVIRNSRGEFMAASICRRSFLDDIKFAETSALLEGIKLAMDLGLTLLVIESDSVNVISLISGRIINNFEIHWIISNIRALICNRSLSAVKHVPRFYNSVAHNVAKMTL
ncbi:hypothetical protein CICLE_v10006508mg, partial [Citrus x clementina]